MIPSSPVNSPVSIAEQSTGRLSVLDGFRTLAIVSVMLYHFYGCTDWLAYYPYGHSINLFNFGYMGVRFFFIISGFVISYSLTRTDNFISFWKKRFIRLYPSMIIASVLIFITVGLFSNQKILEDYVKPENFLPSITFISPEVINEFLGTKLKYLNTSFWSLWPEVQFYFFCSCLYFFNKVKFNRNFILLSIVICLISIYVSHNFNNVMELPMFIRYIIKLFVLLNMGFFISYFALGVIFHELFINKANNTTSSWIIYTGFALFTLDILIGSNNWQLVLINSGMLVLFTLFIYFPRSLSIFSNKWLTRIGICSYFLYLIHEPIGVLSINRFAGYFGKFDYLFALPLILIFILFSIFYSKFLEIPFHRSLSKLMLNKKQ